MQSRATIGAVLGALIAISVLAISPAAAQTPTRVMGARGAVVVRTCPDASCAAVTKLLPQQAVDVVETKGAWHRVIVTFDDARATTGWVDASTVAPAARPAVPQRTEQDASAPAQSMLAARTGSPRRAVVDQSSDVCLACLATRAATTDEWNQALAAASSLKAPTDAGIPSPPAAPADMQSDIARAEAMRRDSQSTEERMREQVNLRFGKELERLAEIAVGIDPDLQSYMTVCYGRYLPVAVIPPSGTEPAPPPRPRASVFDIWRGDPPFQWNDTWTRQALLSAESTAFCQTLWKQVSDRADGVKRGVLAIERDARDADIYPGVLRDALEAYGLAEKR